MNSRSYKNFDANTFSEIGIDPDNNRFFLGISSEIEFKDNYEIRYKKWLKVEKISWFYFRIWVFRRVFGFSIVTDKVRRKKEGILIFWKQTKNRNSFKILAGRAGHTPDIEKISFSQAKKPSSTLYKE